MPNPQVLDYIKKSRAAKIDDSTILAELRKAGWKDSDISEAFHALSDAVVPAVSVVPVSSPAVVTVASPANIRLRPVWGLFKESLHIYFSRIGAMLGILIIPFLVKYLYYAFVLGENDILAITIFFISWLLSLLSYLAIIYVLKDSSGIFESYKKSFRNFLPYLWIVLLGAAVEIGGFVMGIVPGIIFSIWFIFIAYIFVIEGEKGLNVFYRSREYARSHWWGILWRISFLFLVIVVPLFTLTDLLEIIPIIASNKWTTNAVLNIFSNLFFVPLLTILFFLLYKNLSELKASSMPAVIPRKKFFIVSAVIGAPVVLLFFTLLSLLNFASDIPPIDDSDLRLPVETQIPKENNAYYDLTYFDTDGVLRGDYDAGVVDHISGKRWDEGFISKALADNQDALTHFELAMNKAQFQDPYYYAWISSSSADYFTSEVWVTNPAQILGASRLEGLKAISLAKQGKEQEAFDSVLKIAELGKKLEDNPGQELNYLIGSGIKGVGMQAVQRITEISKYSDELVNYIPKLEALKDSKEGLIKIQKIRHVGMMRTLDSYGFGAFYLAGVMAEDKNIELLAKNHKVLASPNFYFKVNKTKAFFVEDTRSNIKKMEDTCSPEFANFRKLTLSPWWLNILSENAVGKFFYDTTHLVINYPIIRCNDELPISATQAILALKAYSIDNRGKLPATLDELVPKYIATVPIDPFSREPLKYSASEKVIYSTSEKYPVFKINF